MWTRAKFLPQRPIEAEVSCVILRQSDSECHDHEDSQTLLLKAKAALVSEGNGMLLY